MNNISISISILESKKQLKDLIEVFSRAFDTDYTSSDEYIKSVLENPSGIYIGAYINSKLVGGVIAFEMTPLHGRRELYMYDIAVHPQYQRLGIGKLLIRHMGKICKEKEITSFFVEAEDDDDDAVNFYRGIGGREIKVRHFDFDSKNF